jgi:hypothetical protein
MRRPQHGPHASTPFEQELGALPPEHCTEHVCTLVQVTWHEPVHTASHVWTLSQNTEAPEPTSMPQSGVLLQCAVHPLPQIIPHEFV